MAKKRKKPVRTKGKLQLSRYFQELEEGSYVALVREPSVKSAFPTRLQGKTGRIEGKRGEAYLIKIKDQDKEKTFLIEPIHLKKIKTLNK